MALKTSGRVASKMASSWSLYSCRPPKPPPVARRQAAFHLPTLPVTGSGYRNTLVRGRARLAPECAINTWEDQREDL